MKSKWTIIGATCLLVVSLLQGCLVAAVGAGIGAAKYGSAKQREQYTNYRTSAEEINLKREVAGLEPNSVLNYDEWRKGEEEVKEEVKED
jgi:hypothetical protein